MDDQQLRLTSRVLVCGEGFEFIGRQQARLRNIFGLGSWLSTLRSMHFDLPKKEARKHALTLVTSGTWDLIVMLGRKTAAAFLHERPAFTRGLDSMHERVHLVALPLPSSSREWNSKLEERARVLLREAAPDLPWGAEYDPLARFAFSLRGAAEAVIWNAAVPAPLRQKTIWTPDDHMVALDAAEERGLSRTAGARVTAARACLT